MWFLAEVMREALGILGKCFHFNFDLLASPDIVARFEVQGEPSLVFRFVLEPIS